MQLRPYQETLKADILNAWNNGARNVCAVSPTGSGKTHLKSNVIATLGQPTCCIAHRQELVQQISESLALYGIEHNIIAPVGVVRFCAERHVKRTGRSYYNPNANVAVAGVQTILRRSDDLRQFLSRVKLWDIDECHHVLKDNQWGKATLLFPNAIGLGVTATPLRCDRKALDGVFDTLVLGPSMRELIDQNHLSDYRIFCPPQSLDLSKVRVSDNTGEYVHKELVKESERSQIVGDVVSHYLKIAPGARGLTFTVDVASAARLADAYNAAGVPAAVVTAKTPDRIRTDLLERLARGDIKQLVNVDLFGEGMDCPTLEVVSMARPTQSYGLYVQQFGRVLRTAEGKSHGIVIDHVGNVVRHGLPDRPRDWSLGAPEGRRARTADPNEIPLTTCESCFRPYERFRTTCPYCGHKPVPSERSAPEHVDGDLIELDPAILAQMRGEVERIDGPVRVPGNVNGPTALAIRRKWNERQSAQGVLRDTISAWAGVRKYGHGETDREIQRRFYHGFGVDVITAQTLGATEAAALTAKIRDSLT